MSNTEHPFALTFTQTGVRFGAASLEIAMDEVRKHYADFVTHESPTQVIVTADAGEVARIQKLDAVTPYTHLAIAANVAADESDRAYPHLNGQSSADDVATWLQVCDPNGCHTAELAQAEGFDGYEVSEAWEALATMLEG